MARRVSFSEQDARRIAAVTRTYERGNRDAPAIRWRQVSDDGGATVRLGKVLADWANNTTATVTVYESGTPPAETASSPAETIESVVNHSHDVASGSWVVVAQAVNGAWYLLEAGYEDEGICKSPRISGDDLTKLEGYDAEKTQVLVHQAGCLKWFDTSTCPSPS